MTATKNSNNNNYDNCVAHALRSIQTLRAKITHAQLQILAVIASASVAAVIVVVVVAALRASIAVNDDDHNSSVRQIGC